MPQKISMILSNNQTYRPETSTKQFQPNVIQAPVSNGINRDFSSSMIGRIHTIKPGCGSCGR
uniref:Uncharacterized protein n=1 Tax=viral metagenome TaxID=1070528 RepID=A0A6C0IG82_9ZZZZ